MEAGILNAQLPIQQATYMNLYAIKLITYTNDYVSGDRLIQGRLAFLNTTAHKKKLKQEL
ncbi:hypothetical protein [Nostoc commune]|uniref:hypothetical protein n=1 Tax=Nostoc commune TaxID=1178 RepID=UPI0020737BB2|nr:hypothetical protein [Nostoc commune]